MFHNNKGNPFNVMTLLMKVFRWLWHWVSGARFAKEAFAKAQYYNTAPLRARISTFCLAFVLGFACLLLSASPASAGLNDDHYDGNIFPLYGGNGYLVPARLTVAEAFKRDKPLILVFYVDDSTDCKKFMPVVSQIDAYYGRAADLIPVNVDAIPIKDHYEPNEAGYYYTGSVPQTVVFDASNKVVLNEKGVTPFEPIDDTLRVVFDLLPRSESVELKRRSFNEFNTELKE